MRVLVTGAAGLTGRAIVRLASEQGHEPIALVRQEALRDTVDGASGYVVADCRDRAALSSALQGVDALVHGAGITHGAAVASAGLAGLHRVVVISTAAVGTRSQSSRETYLANERAIVDAAPGAALLRPTMIYGSPRDRNVHHVIDFARRARFLPLVGGGDRLIQPVHYEDVAFATVALLKRGTRGPVELGGAEALPIEDALREVLLALGARPRLLRVPAALALGLARVGDAIRRGRLAEQVERMFEDRVVDNARAIAETSVRPRSFVDGIRQQVAESVT